MNLGTALVAVKADVKDLRRDLKEAKMQTEKAMQTMQKSANRTGAAFRKMWTLVGGVAAIYAIQRTARVAIKAASDLEEVTSRFNVVFKGQEKIAEDWSDALVESYGRSTREAKHFLAQVQDTLKPLGVAADEAGRLSFEMVKLAIDVGSFVNLPTGDVLRDIISAMVGNTETVRKYGVAVNATVVQQKALEMGFARTKDELTAAHKAIATYQLVLEGTVDAQGDYIRTADSFANTQRRLTSAIEETWATMGEQLLPAATELLDVLIRFNKEGTLQAWAEAIGKSLGYVIRLVAEALEFWAHFFKLTPTAKLEEINQKLAHERWLLANINTEYELLAPTLREEKRAAIQARIDALEAEQKVLDLLMNPPKPETPTGVGTGAGDGALPAGIPTPKDYWQDTVAGLQMSEDAWIGHAEKMIELRAEFHQSRAAEIAASAEGELDVWVGHYAKMEELAEAQKQKEIATLQARQQAQQAFGNAVVNLARTFIGKSKAAQLAMLGIQIGVDYARAVASAFAAKAIALATPPVPNIPLGAAAFTAGMAAAKGVLAAGAIGGAVKGVGIATSGGGGGGGGGVSATATPTPVTETQFAESQPTYTFNIEGDVLADEFYIEKIAEKFSEAVEGKEVRLVASEIRAT